MSSNHKGRFVNVGTIGHVDHGKSTLAASILNTLTRRHGESIDKFSLRNSHENTDSSPSKLDKLNRPYRAPKSRFNHYKNQRR
jgi:translation initiation factor 2 gamma subunit (eIF-2gamma)